jgi:vanillate O-demethylase monooxygenase subunit
MNELPAPFHKQMGGFPDGMKVDRWQVTQYGPPSFIKLDIGSAPVGTPVRQGERGKGVNMWNLNAITPETEKTAHYFFAQAYNFRLDEPWVGSMLAKQITDIFMDDMAMVKAQQTNMDLGPSPVVNLGQDKAWIVMRQIVERLVKEEQQKREEAPRQRSA